MSIPTGLRIPDINVLIFRIIHIFFLLIVCAAPTGTAHTLYITPHPQQPDSSVIKLKEVDVKYSDPASSFAKSSTNGISLGVKALRNMTSFMGHNDPIRIMQSLPAVASNDVISGGIYVQGCENAHNLVTIDGAQVYNPSHLFGLFSVFNTPHFQAFDIRTDSHRATDDNFIGATISGYTYDNVPYHTSGEISVGIIDTHATVRTPIKAETNALTVSGRITYVNALFGDRLKLDNAPIRYGFSDWNATFLQRLGHDWMLKVSAYLGSDNMRLPDPNYASDLRFGWTNAAASASIFNSGSQRHTFAFSTYSNRFDISYADIHRKLPSSLRDYSYSGDLKVGNFNIAAIAHIRDIEPQHTLSDAESISAIASEISAGADYHINILPIWDIVPGIKFSGYSVKSFHRIYPLPSLNSTLRLKEWMEITLSTSRLAQFCHKIEESTMGLPTDYWIAADKKIRPLTANCGVVSVAGSLISGNLAYSLSGYYRDIRHMTDWRGMLFNLISDTYDPSSDILSGKGRAWGMAAMIRASFGNIQGWVSYNYGKSRILVPDKEPRWRPSSHDRSHDININLSWHISNTFTASASWVYATGRPYTEPLYGYMIGENLICEFKPLNSSSLPDMHRLDLSLDWNFRRSGKTQQGLTASVYNAYGNANTLFVSYEYSPDKGFYKKRMDFSAVIPYISYYLRF